MLERKKVSVIIPAFRDWERLGLCIDALESQTFPRNEFEIIVVNNDKNDSWPEDVRARDVRLVDEPVPGSYAARNAGIGVSAGDILCFTDSDCIPARDWIEQISGMMSDSEVQLVAGQVRLFSEASPNIYDKYERVFGFPVEYYVRKHHFGVTANLAVRKSVFEKAGLFNAALKSGGDVDFCQRARRCGFIIRYGEEAVVNHPTRGTFVSLKRKVQRIAGKNHRANYIVGLGKALLRCRVSFSDVKFILDHKGLNAAEKMHIFFIRQQLKVISAIEGIKILNGKQPNRE